MDAVFLEVKPEVEFIRSIFSGPNPMQKDSIPRSSILRIRLKNNSNHTFIRLSVPMGQLRVQPEVWQHVNLGVNITWQAVTEFIHKNLAHIEWIKLINPDLAVIDVYPAPEEPSPEEKVDTIIDGSDVIEDESAKIPGVYYRLVDNSDEWIGTFPSLAKAKWAGNMHWGQKLTWLRENAFTWRPEAWGTMGGFRIKRVGKREK